MAGRSASGNHRGYGHRMLLATLLPALLLAPAGCGSGSGGGSGGGGMEELIPPGGDPGAALARWRTFPAEADPRPLVLVGGLVAGPASGFSGGPDKEAYLAGAFDIATTLPAGPATADGYSLVPAKEAVDRLRATAAPGSTSASRLRIVSAALGQYGFGTDRGVRRLPAWRFGIDGVRDPAWVLAVDSPALWPYQPDWGRGAGMSATLQSDGRTVSYEFIGGPDESGPCGAHYSASAKESATAAVIEVRRVSKPQPAPPREDGTVVVCNAMGYRRAITVQLAAPLGGRVLLTPDGAPIAVTGGG